MNLTLDRKLGTWTSCNYQTNVLLRCWRTCLQKTSWSVLGEQIRSLETLISRAAPLRAAPLKAAWLHPSLQGKHLLFEARGLVCLLLLLCLLPMAAVTGDHTFSRFTLSVLLMRSPKWVSAGSYQSTLFLSEDSGKNSFSCLFRDCLPPLGSGPFYLQSQQHSIFKPFWLLLPSSTCQDPNMDIGSTWTIQDNLKFSWLATLTLSATFISLCHVPYITYSRIPRIRMWASLGAFFSSLLRIVPVIYQVFNRYLLNE